MNERIKILLESCINKEMTDKPWPLVDNEKFAELIVYECINAVIDGTKEGDNYAMRIEQHFDNGQGGILHFGIE